MRNYGIDNLTIMFGWIIPMIFAISLILFPIVFTFSTLRDKGYDFVIAAVVSLFSWVGIIISLLAPVA